MQSSTSTFIEREREKQIESVRERLTPNPKGPVNLTLVTYS